MLLTNIEQKNNGAIFFRFDFVVIGAAVIASAIETIEDSSEYEITMNSST